MGYVKNSAWVNGDASRPLNADRMNHIEDGIFLGAATADSAAAAALAAQGGVDDLETLTTTGRLGETELSATFAGVAQENTFTEPQTFDPADAIHIGDKLQLRFTDGFFGQRLHLTGLPQGPGEDDIMPYLEVAPTTQTGTDVGGAIAGFQVYRTVGGGGVPDREFLAIEASGDLATLPGFKIATWASGTGTIRPLRIVIGTEQAMVFQSDSNIIVGPMKRLYFEDHALQTPIIQSRSAAGQLQAIQARQYGTVVADAPAIVLSKNRGTIETPTYPLAGDILGETLGGTMDPAATSTFRSGGGLRIEALQNWASGQRGSLVSIRAVPNNSGTSAEMAAFADTIVSGETAFLVRVNRAGVYTRERVSMGAADSGGTGYKVLRVAN